MIMHECDYWDLYANVVSKRSVRSCLSPADTVDSEDPGPTRNLDYKDMSMLKSMLVVARIFKPGFWLAGGTAASQPEDRLENPC